MFIVRFLPFFPHCHTLMVEMAMQKALFVFTSLPLRLVRGDLIGAAVIVLCTAVVRKGFRGLHAPQFAYVRVLSHCTFSISSAIISEVSRVLGY